MRGSDWDSSGEMRGDPEMRGGREGGRVEKEREEAEGGRRLA